MTLADEPTTAEMDPLLLVEVYGEDGLFGFATWHPQLARRSECDLHDPVSSDAAT